MAGIGGPAEPLTPESTGRFGVGASASALDTRRFPGGVSRIAILSQYHCFNPYWNYEGKIVLGDCLSAAG